VTEGVLPKLFQNYFGDTERARKYSWAATELLKKFRNNFRQVLTC